MKLHSYLRIKDYIFEFGLVSDGCFEHKPTIPGCMWCLTDAYRVDFTLRTVLFLLIQDCFQDKVCIFKN